MIVEILGARMLSPYVGTSHFVWTAQIAVTLVALACGYYLGGRLVDNSQRLARLYSMIFAAAVYLTLTTLFCERIAYGCLRFELPVATLCASTVLFFIPLLLLAMTGPFLIRVLTNSITDVGSSVGKLTAISTLGSFVGTILIGYVLIPLLPNSMTMCLTAGLLMMVCLGYFVGWNRHRIKATLITAVVGFAFVTRSATMGHHVSPALIERFHSNSPFGVIQVLDVKNTPRRYLLNDYLSQNIYDHEQNKSVTLFTYMLSGLPRAYLTNIQDVLCIGLGIGSVPMDFSNQGANVDVVEINPIVATVAAEFFGFKPEKVNVVVGDGRYFLNQCRKQYDVIVLDAFVGDSMPSHLMTKEAFVAMQRVLKTGGLLVINSFGAPDSKHDFLAASLQQTLKSVFKSVRVHNGDSEALFFVASDRPELTMVRPQSVETVHPSLQHAAEFTYATTMEMRSGHGRILTDDFNPAEFFDAHNREMMRRELAMSMKRMQ